MSRRRWILLAMLALLLAGLAALVYWTSRPPRLATLVTTTLGRSLGLEISIGGASEYRLRGAPLLVVRDVVVREPGAATPLLRADRIHVSVPWATIRSRGGTLSIQRLELDRPRLDLRALQHWLATRPKGEERVPELTRGLQVNDGTIVHPGWSVTGLHASVPSVHPGKPVRAMVRGRYVDAPLAVPFNLDVTLSRPARRADLTARGSLTLDRGDWSMPSTVVASGPLDISDGLIRVTPLRFGAATRYVKGGQGIPFVLGLHGPLVQEAATWTLSPAAVVLRDHAAGTPAGRDTPPVVPDLRARGGLVLGRRLSLDLEGNLADWPAGWPALPPPVGQSSSPLPFRLRYDGATDMGDTTALALRRDDTRFDGRFRIPAVLEWSRAAATGTPLPPLQGTLHSPRLDVAGARLEGVEIEFEETSP